MSQPFPFDEIYFEKDLCFKGILNTPDDTDVSYFLEVGLRYPDIIRQKTKHFPVSPGNNLYLKMILMNI